MAETDLISRQAAIDAVNNLTYPSSLVDVKRILVDLPSAQPERMTNGHWIFRPFPDDWMGSLYICSECGDVCDSRYRFCPFCGAKMDEFEEE